MRKNNDLLGFILALTQGIRVEIEKAASMQAMTHPKALRAAAGAAALLWLFGGAARAGDAGVEAKIDYCQVCHGEAGRGFYGFDAMPRLAGQQPAYLERQLRDYASGRRAHPVMSKVAQGVPPAFYGAIAAHFHAAEAPPLGGGEGDRALGREIFANGLPEANIPACSACHGADGRGGGDIPRLAGQLPSYLVKALSHWDGRGSSGGLAAIMVPTTHNLSAAQMAAVAAYVGALK